MADGVIIDIRSQDARAGDGVIPGSMHIPRTVLEWRVASNLVQLGFHRAGDVIGGFEPWKHDGFPIAPCSRAPLTVDGLPGTGPPE